MNMQQSLTLYGIDKLKDKLFYHQLIHKYFLEHYSAEQIPKLYATIFTNLSTANNNLAVGQSPTRAQKLINKSLSHIENALKYMELYQKQLENGQLTELSKFCDSQAGPADSALHGKILCHLSRIYFDRQHLKKGIVTFEKAVIYYVNKQQSYTIYTGTEALDFVMDFIKHMIIMFDFNEQQSDYHKKWKRLLIKAAKTLRQYPRRSHFDRYGRCFIYFGIINFLWFPQKIKQAIKYLEHGMKKMKKRTYI